MHRRSLGMCAVILLVVCAFSFLYLDLPVAQFFRSIQKTPLVKGFKWLTRLGESHWYLIPTMFLFLFYRKINKKVAEKSLFVFSSVAVSGIGVLIVKMIAGRCRPRLFFRYDLYGFDFFRMDSDYLSFPSGHSATALSLTVALGLLFPKSRYFFWVIGGLIAISRVVVTAHFISDILAGSFIGLLTAIFLYDHCFEKRMAVLEK